MKNSNLPKGYIIAVVDSLPARVYIALIVIMDIIMTIMDLAAGEKTSADQGTFQNIFLVYILNENIFERIQMLLIYYLL